MLQRGLLGFKTIISPSKDAIKRHLRNVGKTIHQGKPLSQHELILTLNPMIRGWANYYRTVNNVKALSTCDHLIYMMLRRWAKSRHPRKGRIWVWHRYWKASATRNWNFRSPEGSTLQSYSQVRRHHHVKGKVKGNASPFDGNLLYWVVRLADHPLTSTRLGNLLREQQGRCRWCHNYFRDEDLLEIDHSVPTHLGGSTLSSNLQVLHRHCHGQKSALDGSRASHDSSHGKSYIMEEPCASNEARTVLKAGGEG